MNGTITRRPRAETDLLEIWTYVADNNEAAAHRLLTKIGKVVQMLAEHPEAGRARPELASGLRSFSSANYVIFYQTSSAGIDIVRVLSGYLDYGQDDVL